MERFVRIAISPGKHISLFHTQRPIRCSTTTSLSERLLNWRQWWQWLLRSLGIAGFAT
jgi:hypothetical protein